MEKNSFSEIDKAANMFAKAKGFDIARYVGDFKGKRIYILEYNTIRNAYGGLPQFIYANSMSNTSFNYVSTDDKMNIIAYLALQDQH